jgi:hypothetical protein
MSFLYNGQERLCPVFVPGREQQPCRRHMCLAFELKTEFYETVTMIANDVKTKKKKSPEKYRVSYCHALKRDLDVEKID